MRILGLDSSMANFGWAVAELHDTLEFLAAGVLSTKPGQALKKGDDASIRTQQLYRWLLEVCREWKPELITVEGLAIPFGKTSHKTTQQNARARAVVDCLAVSVGARLVEYSPQAMKVALTGSRSAQKPQIIAEISRRYPFLGELIAVGRRSASEHIADAGAAIHAYVVERTVENMAPLEDE